MYHSLKGKQTSCHLEGNIGYIISYKTFVRLQQQRDPNMLLHTQILLKISAHLFMYEVDTSHGSYTWSYLSC